VTRLTETFEHYVEVERDQWLAFMVGPENPDFVPVTDVSPYLIKSLMTTEDSAFYKHRGFIVKEFRTALIKNLEAGYFKYGASSITMQLVKNALLYREKTAARKFQELFLTWYIETLLEKDRILEIYLNIIEYGPGLYGIGPAAKHYFGKHPRDLTPVEAAFFSSILPNPKERYAQYCQGTLRNWTEDKIQRILGLMRKRDRLTEEEYVMATITPLVFEKDGSETEEQCMDRRRKAMKNSRPTNPLKK
jgi:membrane peptidoglycan carboxypeptidase